MTIRLMNWKVFGFLVLASAIGVTSAVDYRIPLLMTGAIYLVALVFLFPKTYILITLLYVILVPKISIMSVPGTYVGIRGEDLLIFLFLAAFLIKRALSPSFKINKDFKKINKLFLFYAVACLLSVCYGIYLGFINNPLLGFMFLFRKIEYFIFIFLGYIYFTDNKNTKKFIKAIDVSVVILLIIGIFQKFGIIGAYALGRYDPDSSDRIMSTFSGAYEYSSFLVMITPIYIYRMKANKKLALFYVIFLAIIGYSVLITEARIALVAFSAMIAISIWKMIKSNAIKLVIIFYAIGLTFVGGALAQNISASGSVEYLERFSTIDIGPMIDETKYAYNVRDYKTFLVTGPQIYFAGSDLSYSMRMSKWLNYIDGVQHNPIFGLGLSTTGEAVDGNYIRYLAESGLLGFSLWLMLILTVLKVGKKVMKKDSLEGYLLYSATIGLLMIAVFIDVFEASKVAMLFWFIVGWSLVNLNKKHLTE